MMTYDFVEKGRFESIGDSNGVGGFAKRVEEKGEEKNLGNQFFEGRGRRILNCGGNPPSSADSAPP